VGRNVPVHRSKQTPPKAGKLPHGGPGGGHYGFAVGDWADNPVAAKPSSETHYLKELHKPDKVLMAASVSPRNCFMSTLQIV
jgi:hypothetical protein